MRTLSTIFVITLALVVGCEPASREQVEVDLWPAVLGGGWLQASGRFDLRGHEGNFVENPLLWKPLSVLPISGWERAGRGWKPVGQTSILNFWHQGPGADELLLELRNRSDELSGRIFELEILLNGERLGSRRVEPGRFRDRLPIPDAVLQERNRLEFRFSPGIKTESELGHPIALLGLGLSGGGVIGDPPARNRAEIIDQERSLRLFGSGTYLVPLPESGLTRGISFNLRYRGKGLATAVLELMVADGSKRLLDSLNLEPGPHQSISISLEPYDLRGSTLLMRADLPTGSSYIEIEDLIALNAPPKIRDSGSPGNPRLIKTARPPDVVVIILDAARGDRFPGWSYPRQTTPTLDLFSSEAVVFRHAFAECPTTSCSIPALLTGLSLMKGGEVETGRQMSDELITLAEYLKELGYRTVGFSATPNNSARRNMDQGFDTFRELWGRDNPDHGPFNMSRLAGEVLRSQPDNEPLYLQLHYLPPHQPYNPGPEFDRFTDPEYSGPIVPKMSLKRYSLGQASLAAPDLAQLIGLYDGNMLKADAAVAELLSVLKSTMRFDNSIIIVTSDHGEAFMEHGHQGHNTTLYDEMLHVPLLIRLPAGQRPQRVDTSQLASLLDVVPTVLGLLGATPPVEIDGWDLFNVEADRAAARRLISRTSHAEQPMISVRTTDWKMISWPKHQVQSLFHVVTDPAEQDNRVGDEPLIFANLGLWARDRLLRAQARSIEGDELTLDADAEEALRSLGYLD
jgi:arylsulfatase A-like enzyme